MDWQVLWDWLSNPSNQQTLAWIDGGAEEQVFSFFRSIDEAHVAPDRIGEKLVEIAGRYKRLVAQVAAATGDDPEVAKLKGEAKAALDIGELERADDLLGRVQADAALEWGNC